MGSPFVLSRVRAPAQTTDTERSTDKPAVAFFLPDLSVGGAEQVTITIANGLTQRGYDVDLLLSREGGELQSQLAPEVTVVELSPSRRTVLGVAAHLPALEGYLRRERPAVLFSQMAHVNVVALALNRLVDPETAVVPTHHTGPSESSGSAKGQLVRYCYPYLYPAADQIIAVSEGIATDLVAETPVEPEQISVIHNPVDIATVQEQAREPVDHEWFTDEELDVVLFVGRLSAEKDLETWLRAFERVHEQNPDARAVVVGDGPEEATVRERVDQLDIADVVDLVGYVDNPYRYMRNAAVFLLSSRYEGLPTVVIEALVCGCPVVATDSPGGTREILADGEYGSFAPVGDDAGLAAAVLDTLAAPTPAERLEARAEDFSLAVIIDEYEAFIAEHAA
jgi:glycosyltransferase involved in cell wall biosynthesis